MPSVDQLSDDAHRASKLAMASCSQQDHQDASEKHKAAFMSAQASSRPSLAQHHLQAAASHDRHADPTTPEGKGTAAHRASVKARTTGKPDDHDAAEHAHRDAEGAARDMGDFRSAERHASAAADHAQTAHRIRNPRGIG